jgi:predicted Zn-dependent protease
MMVSFKRFRVLTAVLLVLTLAACDTAPETGRKQLLLIDPGQETKLGVTAFQQKKRQTPIARNPQAQQQLQAVGVRLARVAKVPNARWEFVLFEDPEPNAFALPGGKVGVNTGILPITKDEVGLATVVAHEIAHVSARHGAERMSQGAAVQLGGTVLNAVLGATGYSGMTQNVAMQAFGLGAQYGLLMPYSRTQEAEADRIGLMYMARAGYDPREAIAFWQRFQAYNAKRGGKSLEFLSSHPLDKNRIANLQKYMPQAMAAYRKARGNG